MAPPPARSLRPRPKRRRLPAALARGQMGRMTAHGPGLAEVAALVGDPARANMLAALMDGRTLTASELAFVAGVAAPTASGHLARLTSGNLLSVERRGRQRHYGLASPLVARMVESIMAVAAVQAPPRHVGRSPGAAALRDARTCYDHLAGRLGVAVTEALVARGHLRLAEDGGEVTAEGGRFLARIGVEPAGRAARPLCRPCLDWSERRHHLAGRLGEALCRRCFDLGWIERMRGTRAVRVTVPGRAAFAATFGVEVGQPR